jgi:hypothetical protein
MAKRKPTTSERENLTRKQAGLAQVAFSEIKFTGFELSTYAKTLSFPLDIAQYVFKIDLATDINEKVKILKIQATLECTTNDIDPKTLATMSMYAAFQILNFDEVSSQEGEEFMLPIEIIQSNSDITLGIARGMFAMCVKDTIISNAMFPWFDVRRLVREN